MTEPLRKFGRPPKWVRKGLSGPGLTQNRELANNIFSDFLHEVKGPLSTKSDKTIFREKNGQPKISKKIAQNYR